MRTAIVSDIHGNLTAFEAVLADLRETSPDLVLHGGDLGDNGSSPCEVLDRIRDLGWQGVVGNTDEMLFDPDSLSRFASGLPQLKSMWDAIEEMAADVRERIGEDRLKWLRALPREQMREHFALVHARPDTAWRAPMESAADSDLQSASLLQDAFPGLGGMLITVREEDAARAQQLITDYRRSPDDAETAEIDIIEEPPPKA